MTWSFGALPDGDAVTGVRISAGQLRATILSWGATLQDLRFDPADNRSDIPLVLGSTALTTTSCMAGSMAQPSDA